MVSANKPKHYILECETAQINFSSPAFHLYALDYYNCVQSFQPKKFSPVPYVLFCKAIELQLKSHHLEKMTQDEAKREFSHNLIKLYDGLPTEFKSLDNEEMEVLKQANDMYCTSGKYFDYIQPLDASTGFDRFPELAKLDAVAKKLLRI